MNPLEKVSQSFENGIIPKTTYELGMSKGMRRPDVKEFFKNMLNSLIKYEVNDNDIMNVLDASTFEDLKLNYENFLKN